MQYIKIFSAIYILFCLLLAGCSVSTSVGTSSASSDSSSSICKSSSEAGDTVLTESKKSYQKDVASFTDLAVHSGISNDEFMQGLSRIAVRHGITGWDMQDYTYEAIGVGLKNAKIPPEEIPGEYLLKKLVNDRQGAMDFIMNGYNNDDNV